MEKTENLTRDWIIHSEYCDDFLKHWLSKDDVKHGAEEKILKPRAKEVAGDWRK